MARMSDKESTSRENIYVVPPEELTIIEDKDHPLYDERVKLPLSESLVASVRKKGILQPVLVRRNGDALEVVDGRQRVRAALAANDQMAKNGGGDPIRVRYRVVRGDDKEVGEIMVIANEMRVTDPPTMRAAKMQRYIDKGYPEAELAILWDLTVQTVKNKVTLLDLVPKVRKAVDSGQITEVAAYELAKIKREEQEGALDQLFEAGQAKGGGSKAAARSIRKGGKAKKKNAAAKKMKPRHWAEGFLSALEELGDKPQAKLSKAIVNTLLGDTEALSEFPAIGAAAARVNRNGTLVTDEEE